MILQPQSLRQACRQKYPLLLACLSFSLLVVGCSSQSKAPQSLSLHADTIVKKNFRQIVSSEGIIGNNNFVPFKPAVSGIVTQVLVKAGQEVQEGELMVVLENQTQVADLATAEAKAQEAKIEASRYQYLLDAGAATKEDFEKKKIRAISFANAAIAKKVLLSHRYIKAPFDGVIGSDFIVNVGTYVQEGKPFMGLVNISYLIKKIEWKI